MLRNRVRDASGDQKIRNFAETRRSPADFGDRGPKKAVWGPKRGPKGGLGQKRFTKSRCATVSRRPVVLVIGRNRRLRRLSRTLRSLRKRRVRRIGNASRNRRAQCLYGVTGGELLGWFREASRRLPGTIWEAFGMHCPIRRQKSGPKCPREVPEGAFGDNFGPFLSHFGSILVSFRFRVG